MLIDPGELDRRITIFRSEATDDGTATVEGAPAVIGRRWAKKTDVSDGERVRAGQQGQALTTRFLVRSDALTRTITGKDTLECRGVRYSVTGTKESGEREDGIEITAASMPDAST